MPKPKKRYNCNLCERDFDEPAEVAPGLGVASPCCEHHFTDNENPSDTVCCKDCCDEPEKLEV